MGNVKYNNSVFFKAMIILLVASLVWAPMSVFAEMYDENSVEEQIPQTYTVALNANGGTLSDHSEIQVSGDTYSALSGVKNPTRTGYAFLGWFTQASGGSQVKATTSLPENVPDTLYARWGKRYTVTFNPNTGAVVGSKSKYVYNGLTYGTLPSAKKSGYILHGWYTTKTGSGTKITSTSKVNLAKNTTLYARWARPTYTVTFNPYGGSVKVKSKTVRYNSTYGTLPTPYAKGYNFVGWYTAKSGGSKVTKTTKYLTAGHRTLYARWSAKKITIKFNPYYGKVTTKSKVVRYNQKYGTLPKPTRSGYYFSGWYTAKTGGSKVYTTSKMKYTSTKTLYARWSKISKVTFNYMRGKASTKSKNVVYGYKYASLPSTSRTNYTFRGWYTKKIGGTRVTSTTKVGIKSNTTLYAQWNWKAPVKVMLAPKGSKARPGYKITDFKGVTIHNTGNTASGATALSHGNYLQNGGSKNYASWHYCVDHNIATQSIPESENAWHAGDGNGTGNRKTIAIEICMNQGGDIIYATENAAMLTAKILKRHGHKKAVSNSNVFQHNRFSSYGKNCPQMIRSGRPYSWTTFVSRVNYYMKKL